jgi:hypothetical protein
MDRLECAEVGRFVRVHEEIRGPIVALANPVMPTVTVGTWLKTSCRDRVKKQLVVAM